MTSKFIRNLLLSSLMVCFGLETRPVSAQQVSTPQVTALVEALRQAAPPQTPNDGMYSQWQVLPNNIPRWSKFCTKQELTPQQFEADPAKARSIITCIVRDLLQDEYKASGNNEMTAIRRAACWWMTGQSTACTSGEPAAYVQNVMNAYQQQRAKNTGRG